MPPPAERARTLTTRGGTATVLAAGASDRSEPALHHVYQDGSTVLLLPEDHPLLAKLELTPQGEVSAMIKLTDTAPVALRRPIRGLLWITGWLRVLDPQQTRQAAMEAVTHRCDERLLDLGYGSRLLYLHPVFAVLSDAEGTAWLTPADLSAAEADPASSTLTRVEPHLSGHCPLWPASPTYRWRRHCSQMPAPDRSG
ncbi:MAG: DUF2470 domain-containing protein [Actinomycetota bacterium]|nr:DUF2470 domain-containing protein [Actinomycetota bacterium]